MSDHPPLGYRAVAALCRFLLNVFYPRFDVIGAHRIPSTGPLIVTANHHNSVVDAMTLVAVVPRWLRTLANAPLFSHPLIGPFLKAMGGLPVHRRQEAGNDPTKNQALFAATTAALRRGGSIMLFPEGRTQPEPVLLELRTGAARMLLEAEAAGPMNPPVTLLPVGLVFHNPGTFREGDAFVIVGEPLHTREAIRLAMTDREAAARQLTTDLARSLRNVIVEAGDRESLSLLRLAQEIWEERDGATQDESTGGIAWLKNAVRVFREIEVRNPEAAVRLREDLAACARDIGRAGISVADLYRGTDASPEGPGLPALVAASPVAILGIVTHVVPYKLTGRIVARILKDEEEEATDKIAGGFVFFLLAWTLETALVAWLAGTIAAALFAIVLLPLGFISIWWLEALGQRSRRSRIRTAEEDGTARQLRERCRALAARFKEVAGS